MIERRCLDFSRRNLVSLICLPTESIVFSLDLELKFSLQSLVKGWCEKTIVSKTLHNPRPLPSPESLNLGQVAQVEMVDSGAILVWILVCVMMTNDFIFVGRAKRLLYSPFFLCGKAIAVYLSNDQNLNIESVL